MPGPEDVPGPQQLGADRVAEHDLTREDALGDQQPEVRRIGVGQAAAVPLADCEGRDPHTKLALGRLAAIRREELPEVGIELQQAAARDPRLC